MFWRKKRAKADTPSPARLENSNVVTDICHSKTAKLDLRRAVLDWRDRHVENVETHLTSELNCLYRALDQQLQKMTIRDLFYQARFGKREIEPIYSEWRTRESTQLVTNAQDDLLKIFVHELEVGDYSDTLDQMFNKGHLIDMAVATSAIAAGLASIPTFATMSIVSTGGIFGFFGATTILWPVVAVGVAMVGTLMALGGYKVASLKSGVIRRYREAITKSIEQQVLGYRSDQGSLRRQLQLSVQNTANKIITEIDQ